MCKHAHINAIGDAKGNVQAMLNNCLGNAKVNAKGKSWGWGNQSKWAGGTSWPVLGNRSAGKPEATLFYRK